MPFIESITGSDERYTIEKVIKTIAKLFRHLIKSLRTYNNKFIYQSKLIAYPFKGVCQSLLKYILISPDYISAQIDDIYMP